MAPQKEFNIAIVGGGIGGLCLGIGLLSKGVPVTIYEAAPAFAEIGAGVAFGTNATKAMSLISPEIRAAFDRCATNNWSEDKVDVWFDFVLGQDVKPSSKSGDLITEVRSPKGQSSVHRAHYLDELVKLIPSGVAQFGKRLSSYEDLGEDGVVLQFADGTRAKHTALVGCDGIKSRTRQTLLGEYHPAANPTFSGKYAYRGLIPMDKAVEAIGDNLARNSQMHVGHHGHVLTFPVDKGNTMNVVAFRTKTDGKWSDAAWVKPIPKENMTKDFEGWSQSVKSILSLLDKPEIWALFDHPPADTYTKGNVCLLGDAAHATTPHQGSGAGMAIEDALFLSRLVNEVDRARDLKAVFDVYDEFRRPRTQKVVTTSRQAGLLYDMELPGTEDDVAGIGENMRTRMAWIWEEDLEKDVEVAKERLRGKLQQRSVI